MSLERVLKKKDLCIFYEVVFKFGLYTLSL